MQTSSQKYEHILTFQTVSDISTWYLFCNDGLPYWQDLIHVISHYSFPDRYSLLPDTDP